MIDLNFAVLTPPDNSGHRVLIYTPDAGSAAGALELLSRGTEERVTNFVPTAN